MKRLVPALLALTTAIGCGPGLIGEAGTGGSGGIPGTISGPTGTAGTTDTGAAGGTGSGGAGSTTVGGTGSGGTVGTTVSTGGGGTVGTTTTTTTTTAASGLPCNVQSLLQTRCQGCHSSPTKNGAPFSLVTYDDARANALAAVAAMSGGLMPLGGPVATAAEIAILNSWITAGYPMTTMSCGTATTGGAGGTGGSAATGSTGGATGTATGAGGTTGTTTGGSGGSGGTSTTGAGGTGGTPVTCAPILPANVQALVQGSCQGCHSSPPQNNAPFALVSYTDVRTNASLAVAAMTSGLMPLGGPMATAAQIAVLQNWINAGFPSAPCPATTGTGGTGGTVTTGTAGAGGGTVTTGTGGAGGAATTGTGGAGGTPTTGTGGTGGTPATGTGGACQATTLPTAVQNLVQTRCQSCHSSPPKNNAPFALVSYNDVRTNALLAVAAMTGGAMPLGGPPATAAEIAVMQNWINSGYLGQGCTLPAGTTPPPPPPPLPPIPPPAGGDDNGGGGDDNGGGGGNSGPGGGGDD